MTHMLKSFWSFWRPDPVSERRRLQVELALATNRHQRLDTEVKLLSAERAAAAAKVEHLQQEIAK